MAKGLHLWSRYKKYIIIISIYNRKDDNMYIVYKHTNKVNKKSYIGITKNDNNPNQRWRNGMGYDYNKKFFTDIVKYGWDNFTHEILEKDLTEVEAIAKETFYIKKFDCVENGYNNAYGGNVLTEEGRKKLQQALTGIKRNKSSIEKQMATKKLRYGSGRGENYLGSGSKKVKCNETGDIFASIEEAKRWCGSSKVGECCRGLRAHAGKHPITKQQLSWSYADPNSKVTINCGESLKEKVIKQKIKCVETQKIYENASEAARETGIAACNISRVCKGERKTAGNLHWIFI